jgi:hypothetical protein
VLVVGVYLADRENHAAAIVRELGSSRRWQVEQRWIALGRSAVPDPLKAVTAFRARSPHPKFLLLNQLLRGVELDRHEYVLVCDDDIVLPGGFLDSYLELVTRYELALAQPARTQDSYLDHWLVRQLEGLQARRTRFVEIGPLFSIHRDAFPLLIPFDEASPMGWGYDFVWPVVVENARLRMGIVDATPVAHNLRKPVAHYDYLANMRAMRALLANHAHLTRDEAFAIVEAYS